MKASELCYKSISCDATEDKKHIDLSAEPLVLVCAAGLQGSNADDVAKEIAIYRAHRAAPIVIATEGDDRFGAALETIAVPAVHPDARVRAVGHGRSPLRLRGRARHRRLGAPAARGAAAVAAIVSSAAATPRAEPSSGDDLLLRLGPAIEGPAAHVLRRAPRRAATTATSRPAPRCASRRCSATPRGCCPSTCTRSSTARSARRAASWRTSPPRSRPASRSSPARSTRSSTRRRRSRSASPAPTRSCCRSRWCSEVLARRRGTRRAQLPDAAHARRARPRGRAGHRLHPLPHRGRSRRRRRHRPGRRPWRHLGDLRSRTDDDPHLVGTKHRVATERDVYGRAGPQRRPHRRDRARGEGQRQPSGSHCCTCDFAPQLPRRRRAHGVAGLPGPLRRAARRGHRDQPTFDDSRLADDRPRRPAHRPGVRPRRPLAVAG